MTKLEPDPQPNKDQQPSLFDLPLLDVSNFEQHQRWALEQLLDSWQAAAVALPSEPSSTNLLDVAAVVADAKRSLGNGSTPYLTLLLIVAPVFLSCADRELEVIEVDE